MSEQLHQAEVRDEVALRNEVLVAMYEGGWANASGGSVDGPHGEFARISNYREDVEGLGRIFLPQLEYRALAIESVLGHFLLVFRDEPAVEVTQYRDEPQLVVVFNGLVRTHQAWQAEAQS